MLTCLELTGLMLPIALGFPHMLEDTNPVIVIAKAVRFFLEKEGKKICDVI